MPMETPFTRAFDLEIPIVQAPMGIVAGPKLVAAAAEAGALAILPIWLLPPAEATALIRATRSLTRRPFAVNLRADLVQEDLIAAAADEGIGLFHMFWGDPAASSRAIRNRGGRMIVTVSDAQTTRAALDAGADALIAQGVEAGGHVFGTTPLAELVPTVVELAKGVPVAAAGGLADASDVARVLKLGADAAVVGTVLAATDESEAHPAYKQALVNARAGDAALTMCFDGGWPDAPHRVLRNATLDAWERAGSPPPGSRPGEGDVVLQAAGGTTIPRYHCFPPDARTTGTIADSALYAGCGIDGITRIRAARDVIRDLMKGPGNTAG